MVKNYFIAPMRIIKYARKELGMIGGHYFYVGRPEMGIVYLFTGGVGDLGRMYDLFRIAVGDFFDGDGEYLRR